ncbi:mannose-1-phosphate guanylyltransferase [Bacillus sp. 7586-K]|nr:mannose-1-phosphate guanylyltransferase [Bacillus sp. 7586-K]
MKLILLSGGSGKRLWPLSNDSRSKQFLKVLKGKNGHESMVQRVWNQIQNAGLSNDTLIATSKSQVEMIQSQLNNKAELIIEPNRRDTFPAIALASSYLYSIKNISLDETIVVLPVDPYVEDSFFTKITELESTFNRGNPNLALIGVKPTYPSSKYGYIIPKEKEFSKDKGTLTVEQFIEKPSEVVAKDLIDNGALWNCGVFSFKLRFLIDILKQKKIPTDYETLNLQYDELPKISFDYEIVENAQNIVTLTYNGYWKDLGTWNTLTEEMETNIIGKGILSDDSSNSNLINELDIPVTVIGVPNAIVAVSPDGILVSDKEASPRIKEFIGDFDNRPMYEERNWGYYRVLDYNKFKDGNEVLTKRIGISAGKNLSYHFHKLRSEIWTVIKGEGILALDGQLSSVKTGDVIQVKPGNYHSIKAITDLEIIEVQSGMEILDEDTIRLYLNWSEIEEECYSFTNK